MALKIKEYEKDNQKSPSMLDDVYDGCIVHLSGTGGVRRIEVVRGRVYIVGKGRSKGDEIFIRRKQDG